MNALAGVAYVPVTNCYLCGDSVSHERPWLRGVVDYESHTGTYDILYCERCELGLTDPMPTPETVGLLYAAKDSPDFEEVRGTLFDRIKESVARRFLRSLPLAGEPHACLDFGSGNGRFAHVMGKTFPGATVYAADLDDEAHEKSFSKWAYVSSRTRNSMRATRGSTSSSSGTSSNTCTIRSRPWKNSTRC